MLVKLSNATKNKNKKYSNAKNDEKNKKCKKFN